MALRNCCIKLYASDTPLDYSRISLLGFLVLISAALFSVPNSKWTWEGTGFLALSAACHPIYNEFSLRVLAQTEPLAVSLIKLSSRLITVIFVGIWFAGNLVYLEIAGIPACLWGDLFSMLSRVKMICRKGFFVMAFCLVPCFLSLVNRHPFPSHLVILRSKITQRLEKSAHRRLLILADVPSHNNFGDSFLVV
jgi:hypothetical protein